MIFFKQNKKEYNFPSFYTQVLINALQSKINQIICYISSFTSKVALNKHEAPSAITIRWKSAIYGNLH